MNIQTAIFRRFFSILLTLALASCGTGDPLAELEKDGSVYGRGGPTTFTMDTTGPVRVRDLVVAGETIRVARKLNKSEMEIIQALAQKKFDGFMVTALEELRPQFDKKKEEVRRQAAVKTNTIRQTAERKATAAASPQAPEAVAIRRQAEEEIAQVTREEKQQIAFIDTEWHKAAAAKVRAGYGTNFAVPVRSAGGEATVAFASLDDRGIARASDTAYALNTTSSEFLTAAANPRAAVTHQGRQSMVIAARPPF